MEAPSQRAIAITAVPKSKSYSRITEGTGTFPESGVTIYFYGGGWVSATSWVQRSGWALSSDPLSTYRYVLHNAFFPVPRFG